MVIGFTKEKDIMEYFACGVRVRQWKTSDILSVEHEKWSSDLRKRKTLWNTLLAALESDNGKRLIFLQRNVRSDHLIGFISN